MAEYFPLLDRAVSGLTEPTAEARRSIYGRARTALIGQLRGMEPPVPEEDIARESAALDEAIARVEAKFPDHAGLQADEEPPARPPAAPAPLPVAAAANRVPPPPLPMGAPPVVQPVAPPAVPPIVPPPSRERPVLGPRPAAAGTAGAGPAPVPVRPAPRPSLPPRGTRPVMALRPVMPTTAGPATASAAALAPALPDRGPDAPTAAAPAAAPVAGAVGPVAEIEAPAARAPEAEAGGTSFAAALDAAAGAEDGPPPPAASRTRDGGRDGARDGGARPLAPRPREPRGRSRPAIAAGLALAALAMAGMGVAAFKWRDRPEQVVAARSTAQDAGAATAPGKVVERAAPAADADAAPQPTSGAAVPAPVPQGSDTGVVVPSIAVAQRAALLVDAPDDPQRVRTYVGTVVWHLDSVSPGGGQPLASAVKADVDIPEAKLKVTMLMQRNPEPQLPASHTIEFHFLPQAGNVLGPVKQINVPEMRRDDDAPTGDPLAGVPVAITDNYFLVGLTRGAAETQNVRLMAERNWFDMSLLFTSGKLGKLTFEKGAGGQRVVDDALKAWK